VMFITTANTLDTVPGPLRDRMEIIQLAGYTEEEKLQIAKRYLVPRQIERNGLKKSWIAIGDKALRQVIADYTREAGVRGLEREIGTICRKVARRVAEAGAGNGAAPARPKKTTVTPEVVRELLGRPRVHSEVRRRTAAPGIATGLAWTPVGGDVLFIEAQATEGSGKLIITGQLGDVMRESALAAHSWVRSRSEALGIAPERFAASDLHVHLPSGAIKKDGPSAGVALTTALVSAYTGRPVRADVAITGEVTLRGRVLPVGGIKEKLMAAHRAGIKTVMVPSRNAKDLVDIPAGIRDDLTIHLIDKVDDALAVALAAGAGQPTAVPAIPPPTALPAPDSIRLPRA
ncbi:MAG TPA: S16 family serine protease, partial [Kofleriaceae bacterium]|nr:S16 family serine protease [Kofleriaceae bacterium]